METQQRLFDEPKQIHDCRINGHEYESLGEGYYKDDKDGEKIKSKCYRVVFCPKCASSVEICVMNREIKEPTKQKELINKRKVSTKK